jgi:hypothetical protein
MKTIQSSHIDQATLLEIIKSRLQSGKLPCAVAFDIALQHHIPVQKVGQTVNNEGIRLSKCQAGLFGYTPENKIIKHLETIEEELAHAIDVTQKEKVIQCAEIWEIAKKLGMSKLHVSCACETLKLKIKGCQLGAF